MVNKRPTFILRSSAWCVEIIVPSPCIICSVRCFAIISTGVLQVLLSLRGPIGVQGAVLSLLPPTGSNGCGHFNHAILRKCQVGAATCDVHPQLQHRKAADNTPRWHPLSTVEVARQRRAYSGSESKIFNLYSRTCEKKND